MRCNRFFLVSLGSAFVVFSGIASAALDTAVTDAVTAAKTDSLAAIGLLTGVVVAIWGGRKVMHMFGR